MLAKIKEKFNEARKNKDDVKRSAYENVIAKILIAEKSGKYVLPLSDDIIVNLIQKEIKELEETRNCYFSVRPLSTVENKILNSIKILDEQIAELKQYLPTSLTEEEVLNIIRETISLGESNKGKVIGLTVKKIGNQYDRSKIPELVAKVLEVK